MGMRGNIILERVNAGCRSHTSPAHGLPSGAPRASPSLWDYSGSPVSHALCLPTGPPSASHGSVRARLFLERVNLVTLLTKEGVNADRHANA